MKKLLRCPSCGGALSFAKVLVRCAECGPFPLLAGVPVLVPDPYDWCGRYREAVLSTLAEFDAAKPEAVECVNAFAQGLDASERFGDDWTVHELEGRSPPELESDALDEVSRREGPRAWLLKTLPKKVGALLELGCGAGVLSEQLAKRTRNLMVADLSLRAVLHSRTRSNASLGVVMDAQSLPLAASSLDALVAENVVDLLDEPRAFLASARVAVKAGGRLLLTTPDPGELDDWAAEEKWKVRSEADGLPWLRINSSRFVEVYFARALELQR
jgi:SAM-dependent methyltransferase